MHHAGITLEHTPASPREQRVAAEEYGGLSALSRDEIGDVVERMARHCDDSGPTAEHAHVKPRRRGMGDSRIGGGRRTVHREVAELPLKRRNASRVILVMMGDENALQSHAMRFEEGNHRSSVARVDCEGISCFVMQQPDVVVAERGYRVDLEHRGHGAGSGPCMI